MKTRRHATRTPSSKTIVTTLGELIAAAYASSRGSGRARAERAALLLTAPTLARRFSRQLQFVR